MNRLTDEEVRIILLLRQLPARIRQILLDIAEATIEKENADSDTAEIICFHSSRR